MAYAAQSDIQMAAGGASKLLEVSDWDQDGSIDSAVITAAQNAADGLIDSYARTRYATPIESPSSTLIRIAAEECVYWMRNSRGVRSPDDAANREERIAWLRDLAKGNVRPDEPLPAASTAVAKSAWVDRNDDTHDVSRENLKGFW